MRHRETCRTATVSWAELWRLSGFWLSNKFSQISGCESCSIWSGMNAIAPDQTRTPLQKLLKLSQKPTTCIQFAECSKQTTFITETIITKRDGGVVKHLTLGKRAGEGKAMASSSAKATNRYFESAKDRWQESNQVKTAVGKSANTVSVWIKLVSRHGFSVGENWCRTENARRNCEQLATRNDTIRLPHTSVRPIVVIREVIMEMIVWLFSY